MNTQPVFTVNKLQEELDTIINEFQCVCKIRTVDIWYNGTWHCACHSCGLGATGNSKQEAKENWKELRDVIERQTH